AKILNQVWAGDFWMRRVWRNTSSRRAFPSAPLTISWDRSWHVASARERQSCRSFRWLTFQKPRDRQALTLDKSRTMCTNRWGPGTWSEDIKVLALRAGSLIFSASRNGRNASRCNERCISNRANSGALNARGDQFQQSLDHIDL